MQLEDAVEEPWHRTLARTACGGRGIGVEGRIRAEDVQRQGGNGGTDPGGVRMEWGPGAAGAVEGRRAGF
jgi:hypothetical protein